jgi:hypothetical protein
LEFFTELDWNTYTEELLISWADIAKCYTIIYENSYRKYNNINYRFTIPIVIMSTIAGTLSMSISAIVEKEYEKSMQMILGGVNIFTGILGTLQNFFRYAQESESHLSATNDWSKLYRYIKIELSIERKSRRPANEFVRYARQEYERLLSNKPVIPKDVIDDFKKKYSKSDIIKPDIMEQVSHTYLDHNRNIIRDNVFSSNGWNTKTYLGKTPLPTPRSNVSGSSSPMAYGNKINKFFGEKNPHDAHENVLDLKRIMVITDTSYSNSSNNDYYKSSDTEKNSDNYEVEEKTRVKKQISFKDLTEQDSV